MFEPLTVALRKSLRLIYVGTTNIRKKSLRQQSNSDYFFGNSIAHVNIW